MDWIKTGFDFETMARLAKDDPSGFAGVRQELIRQLIGQSSPASQLASLQLDLDAARYGVPPGVQSGEKMLERMLQNTASMTDHVAQLSDLLERAIVKSEP
jgi:hypothetical protein